MKKERNEYEQRLINAAKELSIVSSNSGIPWVRRSATNGYNALVESASSTIDSDRESFFKELYK